MTNSDNVRDTEARPKGRHRRSGRAAWPRLLERLLGRWAPTLRMAVLLVTLLAAGLIGVLAVWGPFGVAGVVLLCVLLRRAMARYHQAT